MARPRSIPSVQYPKTLIIGIDAPTNKTSNMDSYFEEFVNLVKTNGVPYEQALFVRIREIDSTYFLTKGKMEEIKKICDETNIERVIISEHLSPQQARNLEDIFNTTLLDRTDLILEIFEKAAMSAEGKAQVKIAMLQRQKTRLANKHIGYSQQEGAVGLRGGPGETAKESARRHLDNLILTIKRQLERAHQSRQTQRKQRLSNNVPQICLIGYTNAGKSTILNALTKSSVLTKDQLFTTLDTTTRALFIDHQQKGTLSDTVGFIQQLPHNLIEAFKSTLSELQYANLLLHVIDFSDPNWHDHIKVVQSILNDLDLHQEMLYVFNKADKVIDLTAEMKKIEIYQPHVVVSSLSATGIEPLVQFLRTWSVKPS